MYSKFLLLIALTGVLMGSCSPTATQLDHTDLSAEEFAEHSKSAEGAIILDVRTKEEYEKGHLDNAINMDWNAADFSARSNTLRKEQPLFVYCLSGGRSASSAQQLRKNGFKAVYELSGGIIQWRSRGLPERKNAQSTGLTPAQYETNITSSKLVLVDFYAEWCAPCKKTKPLLDQISAEMANEVTIVRINADDHPELCKSLDVNALPTLLLYKNKRVIWHNEGFVSKEELEKILKN